MSCRLNAGRTLGVVATCLVLSVPLSGQEPTPRAIFEGHEKEVGFLAFSPNGKLLASGSYYADVIKVWDVAIGRNVVTLREKDPYLWSSVAFSPDGKTLATGGWFDKVKLWEVGTLKGTLVLDEERQCPMPHLAFSPDGKTLASGGVCRGYLILTDVTTKKTSATLTIQEEGNAEGVLALAFTPNGKTLVSVGRPDEIRVWDVATGKNVVTRKIDEIAFTAAFSPDARTLATTTYDDKAVRQDVKLWDVATGKLQATLKGRKDEGCCVVFGPDGKTLASGYEDGTIKLWDVPTGKELASFKGHASKVWSLAFRPDGKVLASGGEDKTIKLWDVPKAK